MPKRPMYDIFTDIVGGDLTERLLQELDDAGWEITPRSTYCDCKLCQDKL